MQVLSPQTPSMIYMRTQPSRLSTLDNRDGHIGMFIIIHPYRCTIRRILLYYITWAGTYLYIIFLQLSCSFHTSAWIRWLTRHITLHLTYFSKPKNNNYFGFYAIRWWPSFGRCTLKNCVGFCTYTMHWRRVCVCVKRFFLVK